MLDEGYKKFGKALLKRLNKRAVELAQTSHAHVGHIVVFGCNEFMPAIRHLAKKLGDREIVLVSLDLQILKSFEHDHGVHTLYGDMFDADTWEHVALPTALLVVSCHDGNQHAEVSISEWLQRKHSHTTFLATTSKGTEAIELYHCGVHYVIQPDDLAADALKDMFNSEELLSLGKAASAGILAKKSAVIIEGPISSTKVAPAPQGPAQGSEVELTTAAAEAEVFKSYFSAKGIKHWDYLKSISNPSSPDFDPLFQFN